MSSPEDTIWKFGHWLRFGKSGSTFTYYSGFLAADRAAWAADTLAFDHPESLELADQALVAAKAGTITLTQRRLPRPDRRDDIFEYIATKV